MAEETKQTRKVFSRNQIEGFLYSLIRKENDLRNREEFLKKHNFLIEGESVQRQRAFVSDLKMQYESHFGIQLD